MDEKSVLLFSLYVRASKFAPQQATNEPSEKVDFIFGKAPVLLSLLLPG
ncbi:MAG: hypothetical protein IJX02_05105 [Clostridia bacterium]|nr:hypothetical protein [Clostridia bacterium]